MQLPHFVSGSAVILTGWLVVTFFHEVPSQRYPKLQKQPSATSAASTDALSVPQVEPAPELVRVSGSR
jgi:hypothetical protein